MERERNGAMPRKAAHRRSFCLRGRPPRPPPPSGGGVGQRRGFALKLRTAPELLTHVYATTSLRLTLFGPRSLSYLHLILFSRVAIRSVLGYRAIIREYRRERERETYRKSSCCSSNRALVSPRTCSPSSLLLLLLL
jgi:hypothetical protein